MPSILITSFLSNLLQNVFLQCGADISGTVFVFFTNSTRTLISECPVQVPLSPFLIPFLILYSPDAVYRRKS